MQVKDWKVYSTLVKRFNMGAAPIETDPHILIPWVSHHVPWLLIAIELGPAVPRHSIVQDVYELAQQHL